MTRQGGNLAKPTQIRKSSRVRETPDQDKPAYASVAEAMFAQVLERTLDPLRAQLPGDVTPERAGQWVLDFLDRAATPIRVRFKKNIISVGCLDKIERNLPAADPEEYQRIVVPFRTAAEFPVLHGMLFDIREEAERLGIKDPVPRLRRYLNSIVRRRSTLARPGRHGDAVGYRVVVIENLFKKVGRRPTDKDVCKRWDFCGIPTPEKWDQAFSVTTWVKAYETPPIRARLHRIISGYMKEVREKSK